MVAWASELRAPGPASYKKACDDDIFFISNLNNYSYIHFLTITHVQNVAVKLF